MYRRSFKDYFGRDRKALYIVLGIVMISILTLSVVYAALSTTLNINGNAEVSSASWDIHLANVQLNSRSATTTAPTITNSTTATFSTTLSKPGDFYEFTIDVVNDGSIDAMIDGVTKTPTLTTTQAKYLNYIVEYQNGESINNKQLVSKGSFVRLKVKLEFRKDINASDLPTQSETLNLSFSVNYVQSDKLGVSVEDDGVYAPYKLGKEKCYGTECFYIMGDDETSVKLLAKYNLYVGGAYNLSTQTYQEYGISATGIQDSTMIGSLSGAPFYTGTLTFSTTNYWSGYNLSYPAYVLNSLSTLYNHIENYRVYLETQTPVIEEVRLVNWDDLSSFGCNSSTQTCTSAPEWFFATTFWTGVAKDKNYVYQITTSKYFSAIDYKWNSFNGIRPVIVVSKDNF